MEGVFQDRPYDVSEEETDHGFRHGLRRHQQQSAKRQSRVHPEVGNWSSELEKGPQEEVACNWKPEDRYDIPDGTGKALPQQ